MTTVPKEQYIKEVIDLIKERQYSRDSAQKQELWKKIIRKMGTYGISTEDIQKFLDEQKADRKKDARRRKIRSEKCQKYQQNL